MRSILTACLGAVFGIALMVMPDAAEARWLRAESPRFIVYTDGDERVLRDYVRQLEVFDWVLRSQTGLTSNDDGGGKLSIYLLGRRDDIDIVRPGLGSNVAGVYFPATEGIFAVSLRERRQTTVLFHEYAHHFMHQHFAGAYPGWYVEGFAEFFSTVDISARNITIGEHNRDRAGWLMSANWIRMEALLGSRPSEINSPDERAAYYSMAWLLAHWFHSDPVRNRQLGAYLAAVAAGQDSVTAIQEATGLSLATLERTLRSYLRGGLPYASGSVEGAPAPQVEVTTLPASADDLLLLSLHLRVGRSEDDRDASASAVRQAAARHPTDPFARLTLAHAELHFGDPATGVRLLEALVADYPTDTEALQYLALAYYEAAEDAERSARINLLNQSNALLAQALEIDPDDYRTYLYLGRNREGTPGYPSQNDLAIWGAAYDLAPQLSGIRFGLGRALMLSSRFDEAIVVLSPVANNPHGRDASIYAQRLIELARARQPPVPYEEDDT